MVKVVALTSYNAVFFMSGLAFFLSAASSVLSTLFTADVEDNNKPAATTNGDHVWTTSSSMSKVDPETKWSNHEINVIKQFSDPSISDGECNASVFCKQDIIASTCSMMNGGIKTSVSYIREDADMPTWTGGDRRNGPLLMDDTLKMPMSSVTDNNENKSFTNAIYDASKQSIVTRL